MKTYDLFPTLIASETYSDAASFRKTFFDNISLYQRDDGITGEQSGHVDLHLNPEFEPFFKFVSSAASDYVEQLVGSKDIWQPWLVKTWFSDFSVPPHSHSDAHLSFVYYVNVPADKRHQLHFIPPVERLNDLTGGMFLPNKDIEPVDEFNQYNCNSVAFTPQEGGLLMFPARLQHVVEQHPPQDVPIDQKRISIAGDFILAFKEKTARSMGLQPISNWRSWDK
jgi:hypothetical protein